MKRIDLFMPHQSRYSVLHDFTKQMYGALKRQGMKCRLLEADLKNPQPFMQALQQDRPDCTFTFNGFPPDSEGRFLSDLLEIPHVYYLVDSASHFFYLTQSERSIIPCVDKGSVDFFQRHGFSNTFFLPHGTDPSIKISPREKRIYDVVFLGSCIDYEPILKSWKKKYAASLRKIMEEAVEAALEDFLTPIDIVLERVLKKSGESSDDFVSMLRDVEMVVRGKDRIGLLQSIDEAPIDLFGFAEKESLWKKYLGKKKNIILHDSVPFDIAIGIMKQSKIVLNSCPWIRYGVHERILNGLACGALVITDENPYLREQFKEGESMVFYQPNQWKTVNQSIHEYLNDEAKCHEVVEKGRKIVMRFHTWDQRAAHLVKELTKILKS